MDADNTGKRKRVVEEEKEKEEEEREETTRNSSSIGTIINSDQGGQNEGEEEENESEVQRSDKSALANKIDAEASALLEKLEEKKASQVPSGEGDKDASETTTSKIEALKEELAEVRICSKLEALLLQKKLLNNGISPEVHAQKVDKLKVLSESLASSTSKAEKLISEHRKHKEEALNFRVTKSSEVTEAEKIFHTPEGVLSCELGVYIAEKTVASKTLSKRRVVSEFMTTKMIRS